MPRIPSSASSLIALSSLFCSSAFAAEIVCYNDQGPNTAKIQLTLVDDVSELPSQAQGRQTYTETAKVSQVSVELLNYDSASNLPSSAQFAVFNPGSSGSMTYMEGVNYHASALDFSLIDPASSQTMVGHFSFLEGTGNLSVLDKDGSSIKSLTHLFGCRSPFKPY